MITKTFITKLEEISMYGLNSFSGKLKKANE